MGETSVRATAGTPEAGAVLWSYLTAHADQYHFLFDRTEKGVVVLDDLALR